MFGKSEPIEAHEWTNSETVIPSIHLSVSCMSTFSNISFETTGAIKLKFHMKTPYDAGTKSVQMVLVT